MADLIQAVRPMAHEIVETTFRKALDEQISRAIGGEAATYFDAATTGDDEPDTTAPDSTGDQSGPGYETTDIGTLNTETGALNAASPPPGVSIADGPPVEVEECRWTRSR